MMEKDVQMPAPFHRRELFDLLKKVKEKKKQNNARILHSEYVPTSRRFRTEGGRESTSGAHPAVTSGAPVSLGRACFNSGISICFQKEPSVGEVKRNRHQTV
jgi:hypothetical protein